MFRDVILESSRSRPLSDVEVFGRGFALESGVTGWAEHARGWPIQKPLKSGHKMTAFQFINHLLSTAMMIAFQARCVRVEVTVAHKPPESGASYDLGRTPHRDDASLAVAAAVPDPCGIVLSPARLGLSDHRRG